MPTPITIGVEEFKEFPSVYEVTGAVTIGREPTAFTYTFAFALNMRDDNRPVCDFWSGKDAVAKTSSFHKSGMADSIVEVIEGILWEYIESVDRAKEKVARQWTEYPTYEDIA